MPAPRALLPGLLVTAALVVPACGPAGEEPAAPVEDAAPAPPRGVLFIVVDTLRADHVGAFGSDMGLTPNLDALASDALVFTNTVATSSWTRPSVASMFTGQYPTSLDVLTKQDMLSPDVETLAERLGAAGLRCLAVSTNGNAGRSFGFDQGFEQFISRLPKVGYPDDFPVVAADQVTGKALELVDGLGADEPFFLFLHYFDPHDPYLEHPGLLDTPEPPGRFNGSRKDLDELDHLPLAERTADDVARVRWLYQGEVRYCDLWLGTLFDGLRERGLLDELLVVVTADHGEGLYDHGMRAHGTDLYEEQLRVPLVVRFPRDGAPAPTTVESFASLVDITPTILGAYGLPQPEHARGRDLGAAAREGRLEVRGSFAYAEMDFTGIDLESITDGSAKIVRNRAYDGEKALPFEHVVEEGDTLQTLSRLNYGRLNHVPDIVRLNPGIRAPGTSYRDITLEPGTVLAMPARRLPGDEDLFEFFDLVNDPGERVDRSASLEGRTHRLHDLLRHFAAENLESRIVGGDVDLADLDEETIAELRALGYLGGDDS